MEKDVTLRIGPETNCGFWLIGRRSYAQFLNMKWPLQLYASPYKRVDNSDYAAAEPLIDIFEKDPFVYSYRINYVKHYFHIVNWDREQSYEFRLKVFETYDQPRQSAVKLSTAISSTILMFYILF